MAILKGLFVAFFALFLLYLVFWVWLIGGVTQIVVGLVSQPLNVIDIGIGLFKATLACVAIDVVKRKECKLP